MVTGKTGTLINFILTPGQRGDAPLGEHLLESFGRGQIRAVIADAAYDSNAIRDRANRLKAKVCIKPNPTRKLKKRYN